MKLSKTSPKIIISGGGTGGHIYPAIAIADEIKSRMPDAEILFVGALGKMEMEKIPKVGYPIVGLPIVGVNRSNLLSNFKFPSKLMKSLKISNQILKEFKPDVAIGTGGFASGPLLWQAAKRKIPIVIQEQNSFPGITNKILKNKAAAICVAYEGISQFPADKVKYTGNPIRSEEEMEQSSDKPLEDDPDNTQSQDEQDTDADTSESLEENNSKLFKQVDHLVDVYLLRT